MFCISIFQESRRFALVDMLNASRQCDLLELRLDRFAKDPEVGEMLNARPKPVICCCRRPQDGGEWDSTEEERLALLRQCVVSGADYVELELDVAGQIRRYGSTKRVISYTNLRETPENIAEIYAEAQTKQPDVVKLVTRAQTPEEAWPLVQILARPALPTVVVGLGPSSAMLTLLARRTSAPWTYAALERGMEAYPGQLSINDLKTIYRYQDIGKATRFVGVIGSGERERVATALLNTALVEAGLPTRCLPLEVGKPQTFRKVLEAVKISSVLVNEENQEKLRDIIAQYQGSADRVRAVDLIAQKNDEWLGLLMLDRAVVNVLNAVLKSKHGTDNSIQGRTFLIAGVTRLSQAVAQRIVKQRRHPDRHRPQQERGHPAGPGPAMPGCAVGGTVHDPARRADPCRRRLRTRRRSDREGQADPRRLSQTRNVRGGPDGRAASIGPAARGADPGLPGRARGRGPAGPGDAAGETDHGQGAGTCGVGEDAGRGVPGRGRWGMSRSGGKRLHRGVALLRSPASTATIETNATQTVCPGKVIP